jgi:hypothetical protein
VGTEAEASDSETADDDAADDEAADATDDVATDEEATEVIEADAEVDTDRPSAESMASNARASGALREAERYESQGNFFECAQELAPIKWRLSMVEDGDVSDAVEATFNRCQEALEKQYEPIKATDCPFEIEGAIAATAAPSRLVPRAAKAACLALVPGAAKTEPSDGYAIVCPRVELVWSAGGLHRRELAFDGGPLGDELWCCKLDWIAAGKLDGKTLVRVGGSNHPCGGGTAFQETDALYEWNGRSLASPTDISIAYH